MQYLKLFNCVQTNVPNSYKNQQIIPLQIIYIYIFFFLKKKTKSVTLGL